MNFGDPDGATPLGPDEMRGLKFSHVTTRGELDELEQANIQQGIMWLFARKRGDVLDDVFLRKAHERLFGDVWDWAGSYRQREMNIGIDPREIAVQLRMHLDNARYWADEETFTPLEAAARFLRQSSSCRGLLRVDDPEAFARNADCVREGDSPRPQPESGGAEDCRSAGCAGRTRH